VQEEEVVLIVVTMIVLGGMGVLFMAMSNRRALREMEHRERLAMIQRGLVPSPEMDPIAFEAVVAPPPDPVTPGRADRWRSAGVVCIALGLGLMVLLTFAGGEPGAGIGVGGAFAMLGATLLFNGAHLRRSDPPRMRMQQPVYRQAVRPDSHPHVSAPPPPPER
jgi:hypothetical protein